jgi:predicted transcriptional regulator of viral defense system
MRVVATDEARALIAERGGRLYVSVRKARCCGGLQTLATATEVANAVEYKSAAVDGEIEVLVPRRLARMPDQLELEVRRRPRRIEAYWNGCAWVA